MTADEIYAVTYAAGFKPVLAETMTALALRESGGDPNAHNGNAATGDNSWGLWQINLLSKEVNALCAKHGVTSGAQLQDPATSARIAFAIYGGSLAKLDMAWYIFGAPHHPDSYRLRYEAHLPAAHAAALRAA